jgi:hypothetical protein
MDSCCRVDVEHDYSIAFRCGQVSDGDCPFEGTVGCAPAITQLHTSVCGSAEAQFAALDALSNSVRAARLAAIRAAAAQLPTMETGGRHDDDD